MSIDGKLLARARAALRDKRKQHEDAYEARLERTYAQSPQIRLLDAEIRETMTGLLGAALSRGGESAVEEMRVKNMELQERRRAELVMAGFPKDYLDAGYMCPDCRDTGYSGKTMCHCLAELYKAEQRESLSNLFKIGSGTFDSFDLTLYDEATYETGVSPRRTMEIIYETCVEYARKFSGKSMNLFFNGAPGLGKTFLSACIARVVAEGGNSVVYDTASSMFARFEEVRFSRADDDEEARSEVKRYQNCDLLIIDDLGTEMSTAFTVSTLDDIINTRLLTGKKTIVCSNLTPSDLRRRYSEHIISRLEGDYHTLTLHGRDIRMLRNGL